jgi:ATP-binding cassette, subfamily B, multidrug efflux pump
MHSHRIHPRSLVASLLFERLSWRALVLLLSLLATIFGLLAPYAQKHFTDALIEGHPARGWVLGAFAFLVLQQLFQQLAILVSNRESLFSQKALGDHAFARLLEGPGGLVGRAPAGVAVSLFAVDIPGAAALLDQTLLLASGMIFPLVLAPIALHSFFAIPWWASIGSIASLVFVNFLLAKRQSRFFVSFKLLAAERTGLVSEWVQNIRTLRILGWVGSAEKRIFALRLRETANRKKMVTNGQIMNSIASSSTFSLNLLAILLLLKIRAASNGALAEPTPGELLALLWILGVFLARPLRQLPWMMVMTFDALSSVRRLEQALAIPVTRPSVSGPSGATTSHRAPAPAALEVNGLTLESGGRPLLNNINLTLPHGALVAVVGEVGSGKSLLLHSLIGGTGARFHRFALNGEETNGPLDPRVRGKIAFVPQEGFSISASLRENVLFTYLDGKVPPGDEGLKASLLTCQFSPDFERVPHGLDSEIGERGVNLSGGQRQRIGLARAHHSSRPIVLLDDCLSAVDVDTERRLLDQLIEGAWKDHTRLLATHRLAVLPLCHEVIFLADGQVIERGTFDQLLLRSARFRDFLSREDKTKEAPAP